MDVNEGVVDDLMDQLSDNEMNNNSSEDIDGKESDKSFITDLVNKMDNRLTFVSIDGKSEVWNRYQRIYYKKRETDFVKCIDCNDIKKQTKYIGTATLLRHPCLRKQALNAVMSGQTFSGNDNENSIGSEVELYNNKSFLNSLIQTSDQRLSFESQIGKSVVWTLFQRVLFNSIETDYVKCKQCNDIVKQTRYLGTSALVRHRCRRLKSNEGIVRTARTSRTVRKPIYRQKVLQKKKCLDFDQKIRIENKTLKTIVKKCLQVIENCLCVNQSLISDKKRINVLIHGYNEWLNENEEYEEWDENCFEEFYDTLEESDHEVSDECEGNSDQDLDYTPSDDYKPKPKPIFTQRGIKCKNNSIIASNCVKRKYIKQKKSSNETIVCDWPECGRMFKNGYNLQQHLNKTHIGSKKYRCDWPGCDETFNIKVKYEIHMCLHTNEKKYKCDFFGCSYESCKSTMLKRHQKRHSDDKPFVYLLFHSNLNSNQKCEWPGCDYKSYYSKGLRNHQLYHTGERPFRCSWPSCEWKFKQATHLKAHMLKHTGERPYKCEFGNCDRRFASRQAMRFHSEKFHNFIIPLK